MQTFLPYADFDQSAQALDNKRLGKQRVEVLQILNALVNPAAKGWKNHPATRMWRGLEINLAVYGIAICREWGSRGYKDTCAHKIVQLANQSGSSYQRSIPWLNPELCLSHQSNLIRKDAPHYGPLFPGVPDNLPYVWPV